MQREIIALIPASGVGSRMQAQMPKQYLLLQGKTILERAILPFLAHEQVSKIVVAVSKDDPFYSALDILKSPKVEVVFGGETRADSVFNGLQVVPDEAWVLVHDGARPNLKRSDLDKILQVTDENGAILATPAVDTMKRALGSKIVHTEDRSTLWHALTPQFFPAKHLKAALQAAFVSQKSAITDEASAMELAGFAPLLVAGRSDNLKVTRPEDLALAEFYLTR
ncbi:2-C-methyl-D-erythritol 4-phosphate cytidylyltransferase [Pasteurellaceae bacterium RH1A]|nr:2-C-methyl-D-erythritol 4-phosphate cytidylyltransferase [Pasteurellaceae bacterium RH1A]